MLHLTQEEQVLVSDALETYIFNMFNGVNRVYTVDLNISNLLSITCDCNRKAATVIYSGLSFNIQPGDKTSMLTGYSDEIMIAQYSTLQEMDAIGQSKLRDVFIEAIRKRDMIHTSILNQSQRLLNLPAEAISESDDCADAWTKADHLFHKRFNAIKDAIGFTTLETAVKVDSDGLVTLKADTKEHKIYLIEQVKPMGSGVSLCSIVTFDTEARTISYKYGEVLMKLDTIYTSLDCSIDYNRAVDTAIQVFKKYVGIDEELGKSSLISDEFIEDSDFASFKNTTIE